MTSRKHRRNQPVTRREVLRIVQQARDEIIGAIVHAEPVTEPRTFVMDGPGRYHEVKVNGNAIDKPS